MPEPLEPMAFVMQLFIDNCPALALALSADGAANRAGSGKIDPSEKDFHIAQTDGAFFREAVALVDPAWLLQPGLHVIPGGGYGPLHRLKLTFFVENREPVEILYEYRAEAGPPPAVAAFVQRTIELTQAWYDDFRRLDAQATALVQPRPWWKFW
jgi:hypothetical protein